jgi:hypothetical protein
LVGVAFNLRAVREAFSECFPIGILTPDESTDVKCTEVSRVYQAWLRARVGQVDLENHGIGFLSMLAAGGVAHIVCVLSGFISPVPAAIDWAHRWRCPRFDRVVRPYSAAGAEHYSV